MSSKKWFVLGISGVTCGGKTLLANRLQKELKNSVIIHQDHYFLSVEDPRHTKLEELNHFNWELITSIDMDKLRADIMKIIGSSPNENGSSKATDKHILILEGNILFKCKVISDLCDLKYFITLPKDLCWKRRKERTYEPPDVPGYFEQAVWPEYLKYKDELMEDEDLYKTITFIDGTQNKEAIFQIVSAEIKNLILKA